MGSPAEGQASVVLDVEALVQRLNDREVETLKELVDKLDDKERKAAQKHIDVVREERYRKKEIDLRKERPWSNTSGGDRFDEKLQKAKTGIDLELGESRVSQCYEEIKTLVGIEKSVIHKKALEEWERKAGLLSSRVERKRKTVGDLRNEISQLIGFLFVFQGVLLTAVSQSNLLHCNNLWSPIILSVLASVDAIFGVFQKLMLIKGIYKTVESEENTLKNVIKRINALRRLGVEDFLFANSDESGRRHNDVYPSYSVVILLGYLIISAVIFPISHWTIACHQN